MCSFLITGGGREINNLLIGSSPTQVSCRLNEREGNDIFGQLHGNYGRRVRRILNQTK